MNNTPDQVMRLHHSSLSHILIVDDDQELLQALRNGLSHQFKVIVASNAKEALELLRKAPTLAAVIADMRMPGMDGIELLKQAKAISPNTSRLMLTAASDAQTAIQAINEGNVARFLTKPCSFPDLEVALNEALAQQSRLTRLPEEQRHLLHAAIDILVKVIQMVAPGSHALAERLRQRAREIALELRLSHIWEIEVAAMLAPIGRLSSPLKKEDPVEALMGHFPQTAGALLKKLPHLHEVAQMIGYVSKNFDGSGIPCDLVSAREIPIGARILRVARDIEVLRDSGLTCLASLEKMHALEGIYDPDVLAVAVVCFQLPENELLKETIPMDVMDVEEGDILADDIATTTGIRLLTSGCRVTPYLQSRLRQLGVAGHISAKIPVRYNQRTST